MLLLFLNFLLVYFIVKFDAKHGNFYNISNVK